MAIRDTVSCAEDLPIALIASGTSLSNGINLGGLRLFGIVMPSGWDAAGLTILASYDNGSTYIPMKSFYDGTEITYVVNATGYFPIPNPQVLAAATNIKIQSGTSASPVNQTADRSIQLVLRSI